MRDYYETNNRAMPLDYEPPRRSFKPRKWPAITPEMHVKIKRLYQDKIDGSGEVRAFAKRHGLPRWKVTRYAQNQGWVPKQKKEPNWSEAELRVLKNNAQHSPEVICRKLKKAGYKRTLVGIVLKRRRMRFLQNLKGMSARETALCLGEDSHFVTRAIDKGLLKAERRESARKPQQGGEIWYIREKDIRRFIIENIHLIDLRKVDKYWFVELLAGRDMGPLSDA